MNWDFGCLLKFYTSLTHSCPGSSDLSWDDKQMKVFKQGLDGIEVSKRWLWLVYRLKSESRKWKLLGQVWLFVTPWTHTVHRILQTRILEWVAFPFSRGSSQPGNQTAVSCIAGKFFTNWAIREYKKTRSNSKNRKVGESEILYLQMILKIGQNIMLQKSFFTFAFMVCFYEIFFAKSEEGICGKVWKREIKWSRKGNERAAMQDYKSNFESMFKDE